MYKRDSGRKSSEEYAEEKAAKKPTIILAVHAKDNSTRGLNRQINKNIFPKHKSKNI